MHWTWLSEAPFNASETDQDELFRAVMVFCLGYSRNPGKKNDIRQFFSALQNQHALRPLRSPTPFILRRQGQICLVLLELALKQPDQPAHLAGHLIPNLIPWTLGLPGFLGALSCATALLTSALCILLFVTHCSALLLFPLIFFAFLNPLCGPSFAFFSDARCFF